MALVNCRICLFEAYGSTRVLSCRILVNSPPVLSLQKDEASQQAESSAKTTTKPLESAGDENMQRKLK